MDQMTDGAVLHQGAVGPIGDLLKQLAGPNGEDWVRKLALVQANNALFFSEEEFLLRRLLTTIVERVRTGTLTERQLRMWRGEAGRIVEMMVAALTPPVENIHVQIARLERVWAKWVGYTGGFANIVIPARPAWGEILIVRPSLELLRPDKAWEGLVNLNIPCQTWWGGCDIESRLEKDWEEKLPSETTLAWVRDRQEADVEHSKVSADVALEKGLLSENLVERMEHEAIYFLELDPNQHLDVTTWTLCVSGPRWCDIDADVPHVGVDGRSVLSLFSCPSEDSYQNARLREVGFVP